MRTVLARSHRMVAGDDFAATVRHGRRTGRPTLVLHSWRPPAEPDVRVGFVVSKAVGGAVVRNRVKRRLRHLVAARLDSAPVGLRMVVRALPAAATRPDRVADDLAGAWDKSVRECLATPSPTVPGAPIASDGRG